MLIYVYIFRAAFNPHRARNQNITVGVSFGSTRELAFLHADTKNKAYFPQTNGMLFSFGRDVNIHWKHGINALPDEGTMFLLFIYSINI